MNENETKGLTTEHTALEILKREQEKSKAKSLGVIGMIISVVSLAIATAVITIWLTNINYKNDCDWRKLFSDYDFVTQDGGGINNVNGGEQGDLNNGAASENQEER